MSQTAQERIDVELQAEDDTATSTPVVGGSPTPRGRIAGRGTATIDHREETNFRREGIIIGNERDDVAVAVVVVIIVAGE